MRNGTITLAGKEYPLRFSLRVLNACKERYGTLDGIFQALQGAADGMDAIEECLWLLENMLDAGWRYDRINGKNPTQPPDMDMLLDVLDLSEVQAALVTAIAGDSVRTVKADPPKNGAAAAEAAADQS